MTQWRFKKGDRVYIEHQSPKERLLGTIIDIETKTLTNAPPGTGEKLIYLIQLENGRIERRYSGIEPAD